MRIKIRDYGEPVDFDVLRPGDIFLDRYNAVMLMLPDRECVTLSWNDGSDYKCTDERACGPFRVFTDTKLVLK